MPTKQFKRSFAVALVVAALLIAGTGAVWAIGNYEGEEFCRDRPAWPGGSYLGQMHQFHVDHYIAYADDLDVEPCSTWAGEQRDSAIGGLRALGYVVYGPYPEEPFLVWNNGARTIPVNLSAGLWSIKLKSTWERPHYLAAQLHSVHSTRTALLFQLTPEGEWTGEIVLRIGHGFETDLPAGEMVLEVAAPGNWFATFTRAG